MPDRILDPQVEALLAQMAELGQPPFEHMTVAQAREAGAGAYAALQGPGPEVASVGRVDARSRFMPAELAPRLRLWEEYVFPNRRRILQRAGLRHEVHEGADAADLVVVLDVRIGQHFHDVVDGRLLA